MSCLDQDLWLHRHCPDNPQTVSSDSTDTHELARQPLQGLKLASHAALEKAQQRGRLKCCKCGGSRMFFCYTCCSLVGVSQEEIPTIKVSVNWRLAWLFLDRSLQLYGVVTALRTLGKLKPCRLYIVLSFCPRHLIVAIYLSLNQGYYSYLKLTWNSNLVWKNELVNWNKNENYLENIKMKVYSAFIYTKNV